MKPKKRFLAKDRTFWAHVRVVSEAIGYTERRKKRVKIPSTQDIRSALDKRGLNGKQAISSGIDQELHDYFIYRAKVLNDDVQRLLMNAEEAETLFESYRTRLQPTCPLPMNKQKGEMKKPAFLTGLVNMLVEASAGQYPCNYDPRSLTMISRNGAPLRTFARRVDGAFEDTINPIAIWEIKEYYYTTTFGSRVADGIYETLLDGMELEELYDYEGIKVFHYLIIDGHYTWWECGRSYLCRLIDMLNMGLVDEILFGREVISEIPRMVREWTQLASSNP